MDLKETCFERTNVKSQNVRNLWLGSVPIQSAIESPAERLASFLINSIKQSLCLLGILEEFSHAQLRAALIWLAALKSPRSRHEPKTQCGQIIIERA